MALIGITDIVALAKQGYKPADIKELIALAETAPEGKADEEPPAGSGQEPPAGDPKEETEKETEPESAEDAIDYKKKYEEAAAALEQAQSYNRRQDHQPPADDSETRLKDIFASYY